MPTDPENELDPIEPAPRPAFRDPLNGESDDDYLTALGRYDRGEVDEYGIQITAPNEPSPAENITGIPGPGARMDPIAAAHATRAAVDMPTNSIPIDEQEAGIVTHPTEARAAETLAAFHENPTPEGRGSKEISDAAAILQGRTANPLVAGPLMAEVPPATDPDAPEQVAAREARKVGPAPALDHGIPPGEQENRQVLREGEAGEDLQSDERKENAASADKALGNE